VLIDEYRAIFDEFRAFADQFRAIPGVCRSILGDSQEVLREFRRLARGLPLGSARFSAIVEIKTAILHSRGEEMRGFSSGFTRGHLSAQPRLVKGVFYSGRRDGVRDQRGGWLRATRGMGGGGKLTVEKLTVESEGSRGASLTEMALVGRGTPREDRPR